MKLLNHVLCDLDSCMLVNNGWDGGSSDATWSCLTLRGSSSWSSNEGSKIVYLGISPQRGIGKRQVGDGGWGLGIAGGACPGRRWGGGRAFGWIDFQPWFGFLSKVRPASCV